MEENIIDPLGFEALYDSMHKCENNVLQKESVAGFVMHGIKNCLQLSKDLQNDTYVPRPPKYVAITHPKPRTAVSITFRDRVYQRSLNDNIVYPAMAKSFIYDNAACQKGKGTQFGKDRLKCHLQRYWRQYGTHGWVLQCDIKHYYDNMRHDKTEALFHRKLPQVYADRVCKILHDQYSGNKGYNPGSQIVQIAGISALDGLDHVIKEQLRVRYYSRYMDDFVLIHPNKEFLESCKTVISNELQTLGLELHPTKTRIYHLQQGIVMLGFRFRLTETGKVVVSVTSENVKAEKRKLRKLVRLAKQGILTRAKVDQCYQSWKAHARYGDSYNLLQRMDAYYYSLWEDIAC